MQLRNSLGGKILNEVIDRMIKCSKERATATHKVGSTHNHMNKYTTWWHCRYIWHLN